MRSGVRPLRTVYIPHYVPYKLGLQLQEHLVERRARARSALRAAGMNAHASDPWEQVPEGLAHEHEVANTDILLLLQHTPVYTQGRRDDQAADDVARRGHADFHQTKRGGLLTYHGPGQLVGYPILDLITMQVSLETSLC